MNIQNLLAEFEQQFLHRIAQVVEELRVHPFHESMDHFSLRKWYDCRRCSVSFDVDVMTDVVLEFPAYHTICDYDDECGKHLFLSESGYYDSGSTPGKFILITTQAKFNLSSRSGIGGVLSAT